MSVCQVPRPTSGDTDHGKETGRIANDDTVDRIVSFVRERELRESVNIPYETTAIFDKLARPRSRLSTALITAGPNNSNSLDFRDVYDRVNSEERAVFVRLTSDLSSNLKTVLKHINQQATSQSLANGEEFDGILAKVLLTGRNIKQPLTVSKGGRQLNYDLQILCDFGRRHSIRKVIILFEDSEAFEGTLLSDVIEVLRYVRISCNPVYFACFGEPQIVITFADSSILMHFLFHAYYQMIGYRHEMSVMSLEKLYLKTVVLPIFDYVRP